MLGSKAPTFARHEANGDEHVAVDVVPYKKWMSM